MVYSDTCPRPTTGVAEAPGARPRPAAPARARAAGDVRAAALARCEELPRGLRGGRRGGVS